MAVAELTWVCDVLNELNCPVLSPITLYFDNQAAIQIASDPIFHERTKHIKIDCHFIREKIKSGLEQPKFIPTSSQLADMLIKGLCTTRHKVLIAKLGMLNIFNIPA